MPEVVLYCTATCPYCVRAERLLTDKGAEIRKIRVDLAPDEYDRMVDRTGRNTVPQIFIGERHVGGYDDLVELDLDGELDELLGGDV